MTTRHQIIAMGGGGFSMEPDNPLLDRYVLEQTGQDRPKVCFLPTASFDSQDYIDRFYRAFLQLRCEPSHLSLKSPNVPDVKEHLLAQDVLYVGGGDLMNLLDQWHKQRFDLILKQALEKGIVLAGVEAGSMCWFEAGIVESTEGQYAPAKGLGLLEGSNCVHYRSDVARRVAYHRYVLRGIVPAGVGADDGVALHYVDGALARIVSSRPEALAYRVEARKNTLIERDLPVEYLG